MPSKVWSVGEEVLAAQFNQYVQEQVVATFATAAARTTAIPTPKVGQSTYLQDSKRLESWDGFAWVGPGPRGYLSYAEIAATQTGISTAIVDVTSLTTPALVIPAGRRIKISADVWLEKGAPDSSGYGSVYITTSTNVAVTQRNAIVNAPGAFPVHVMRVLSPAAGTYTWKVRANTTVGFVNAVGNANYPSTLLVEDLGPV